jgi:hypothetical protein
LVGRAGFVAAVGLAGRAGVDGLVAVRLVPDRLAVTWSMDVANVGVRSSRPAARSLASCSAMTCRAMSSNGFGLAGRAVLAVCRPVVGFCQALALLWLPWNALLAFLGALAGDSVVAVFRAIAGTPIYGTTGAGQLPDMLFSHAV